MRNAAPPTLDPSPDRTNVAAVIVTFHPDGGMYERTLPLAGQVASILVIDNGSTADELKPVRQLMRDGVAHVILNGQNLGQAHALNQGVEWARDRGLPWVLTLDQDTSPGSDLIATSATVFNSRGPLPFAVIGAGWVIPPRTSPDCDDPRGRDVRWVVTSGALNSVAAWQALGGFRTDFFIDYVDIEYCLRARSRGYLVARACTPTMVHAFGNPTKRRLLRRTVQPSNHSAARRFYNGRNRARVWRAFWRKEPTYVASDVGALARESVKLVLFEQDKRRKLRAMLRGLRYGLRGGT